VENPKHPSFLVGKLWGSFVAVPPDASTERTLERIYVQSRYRIRPLLEAILRHPLLYEGPRLVKPPVVHTAGMLRALGTGLVNGEVWAGLGQAAGQRLFYPPDVGGWDDSRWLDTATFRGRWQLAAQVLTPLALSPGAPAADQPSDPGPLLDRALAFWGRPTVTPETAAALRGWAAAALADATTTAARRQVSVMVENALRQLVAVSPDYMTA
jgi:hypothetical protein